MADAVLDALKAGDVLARLAYLEERLEKLTAPKKTAPPAPSVPRLAGKTKS
jgi:hypothetical protein